MNLLKETLADMAGNQKAPNDVICVMGDDFYTDWENFARVADVEYDSGFGAPEVAQDLIILGKDWWMERYDYDGAECWKFKCLPVSIPKEKREILAVTIGQASNLGFHVSCGWENLSRINGREESE